MKNTIKKGSVRYIVFKEKDTWYAVALEFNIVESGDDPREVLSLLLGAIQGYAKSLGKVGGLRDLNPLNQKPSKEYEDLWNNLHASKSIKSPYQISTYGVTNILV